MTDDRTLDRAARSWLEEGPTRAPDRPVEAALAWIQTISQERDLHLPWIAWRPKTMFDRLAVAAMAAVLAIGAVAFGESLMYKPIEPAAGACPREFSEAEAIDTFAPGLSQAQREWGINGGTPERVRPGPIAAFSTDPEDAPLSVITIDPTTGARCRLVRMSAEHIVRESNTTLDWSPSGDALAIGIERFKEEGEDDTDGQVLIWTANRLLRIWLGPGQSPNVEWAPDGRSIAAWMPNVDPSSVQISFAEGSPDRVIEVQPGRYKLKWSPDGSRWIVAQDFYDPPRTQLSVVDVADGRVTPIDVGITFLSPEGWLDNDNVLILGAQDVQTVLGHLAMPVTDPASYSIIAAPGAESGSFGSLSPDRLRVVYVASGDLRIVDITNPDAVPVEIRPDGDVGHSFAWSPDGSQVVFTVGVAAELWIANADGTGPRELAAGWFPFVDPWQPVPVR
jgi:hypothetical protein